MTKIVFKQPKYMRYLQKKKKKKIRLNTTNPYTLNFNSF